MSIEIINGDCLAAMEMMASNSIDACVTDPPYHLSTVKRFGGADAKPAKPGVYARSARGFMGKTWDGGDVAFRPETWAEVYRVLKPGAHLLAFGGTRTYHRMACAVEDAGFEIRDQLGWIYGSGFPKSHNQSGEWEGWGTALKPAWEPIVMARKPLDGTVANNLACWGTGCLNIDGCRVDGEDKPVRWASPRGGIWRTDADADAELLVSGRGRWPANIIHDGSADVLDAFPNDAHRFFYCAKASRADRDDGLAGFEKKPLLWSAGTQNPGSFQSAGTDKSARNPHPTVKPTDLMRWLCRLVTPPGGTVLDPFMGSGSTGRGAVREGFGFIGCELSAEYVAIARARIAAAWGIATDRSAQDVFA